MYPTIFVFGIIFVFVEYPTSRSRATQYSCWLALYPGTLVGPWSAPTHQSSPRTLVAFWLWFWQPAASPLNFQTNRIWYLRIRPHSVNTSLLSTLAAHLVDRRLGNFIWRYSGKQISTYNWLGFRKWERISLLRWNFSSSWKWKTHLPAFWLSMQPTWFGKEGRLLILYAFYFDYLKLALSILLLCHQYYQSIIQYLYFAGL